MAIFHLFGEYFSFWEFGDKMKSNAIKSACLILQPKNKIAILYMGWRHESLACHMTYLCIGTYWRIAKDKC